jgi:drug/metabolite transporter (DMT)-like permease
MAFLLGGAVLSTIGDADFVLFGFICAVMSTLLRGLKSLLQEYLLRGECVETTIYLLYLMSFPSFLILLVLGIFLEHHVLMDLWRLHVPQLKVVSLVILSCLSAFSYNIFGFLVSIQASAVTIHILGNVKVVLCIAASLVVFGNNVTVLSWIGVIMTLLGGIIFWYGKKK